MRICKDCKIEKPLGEFPKSGKSKKTDKMLYRRQCYKCYNLKYRPSTGNISSTRFKKGNIPWNKKIDDGRLSLKAKDWRKKILERDNNICQDCSINNITMHAHHLKPWNEYPELRFDLNNGVTLCNSCHAKIHVKTKACFQKNNIPWSKGKKFSHEYRQKLSDAHLGQKAWNLGIPMAQETKDRILESRKKYHAKKKLEKLKLENLN